MMITASDFVLFCNRTLDGFDRLVAKLEYEQLNTKPDLAGANTVFQLVVHATAACTYWVDHIVCGNPTDRDRDTEFQASGSTEQAVAVTGALRELLAERAEKLATTSELAHEPQTETPLGQPWTTGAALIHAYEELAQHLGHAEITADLIRSQT